MSLRATRRGAAPLVVLALLAGACGGGGNEARTSSTNARSDTPPAGLVVRDGVVDVDSIGPFAAGFEALSDAEQRARLAREDLALERALWATYGLEDALGGPGPADDVFAAHSEALTAAGAAAAEPQPFRTVRASRRDIAGDIGGGLFAATLILFNGPTEMVQQTDGAADGDTVTVTNDAGVRLAGDVAHAELDMQHRFELAGVTSTFAVTLGVSPCPDAMGRFEATARLLVSATTTDGSVGQTITMDAAVTGQADDDAHLVSTEVTYEVTVSGADAGRAGSVAIAGTYATHKAATLTAVETGDATLVASLAPLVVDLANQVRRRMGEAAEKGWLSGRCVRLEPTVSSGPSGMKPNASSTITAAPRSRIDGAPVGGTVRATLAAGETSVAPDGREIDADATFEFTAPGEEERTGTVALEARSRRGVARAELVFDTNPVAYVASGGGELSVTGTVTDVAAPFTLHGAGQGFTVTFSYTPNGPTAGSYTYTGGGSGVTLSGAGTYRITGSDPDPLTLTQTAQGCVSGGGCRTTTDVITLTRRSS